MYPWCSKKCNTEVTFYRNLEIAVSNQLHADTNGHKGKHVTMKPVGQLNGLKDENALR